MKNNTAASGDEPEATIFLIFFIKFGLVAIASNQDIRHPSRRPSHDRSDAAYTGILRAFDNKLIMDMTAYLLIREVMHRIAEKVSGNSLDDILRKFRTVGFDALPFLGGANSFVGNGVRRHIVGGANCILISALLPPRLCRIGTCRRLSA